MVTERRTQPKVKYPYVTRKKDTCGGKPILAGTRIKVEQIAIEYERMGLTPDEIVEAHPHLTLSQVHGALAFYYDHIREIDADIRAGEALVSQMRKRQPGSVLRNALEQGRGKTTHLRR